MPLSDPQGQFGVHSICLYSRTTQLPLAYLRVIGECTVNFEAEWTDLEGGSNLYPWDSEVSKIGSDISLTAREYDGSTMEIFMGGTLTTNSAETTGGIEGLANVNGTSVYAAGTGIVRVDVTASDEGDLKEGIYVIKATAAQAAEVYCMTDVDFKTGTDTVFENDDLKVGDLDFSGGVDVALADYGLTFEIGSDTTAFTTNDTASFVVRKVNNGSIELVFGQSGADFSEVGCLLSGQKQADGTISTLQLYKCKVAGMPISFNEKAFSEWSVTVKSLYDSAQDAIGKFRRTTP